MRMPRLAAAAVALTLMTAACGDSTGPQIELSDAEAEALFDVLDAILDNLDFGAGFSQASPVLPGLMLSASGMPPVNESAPCTGGGNVAINGNVNGTETSGNFDVSLDFNNCRENSHTVDGALNYDGDVSFSGESFSLSSNVDGTLTVTLPDGRTGACRFDYSVTFNSTTASVSGSVCGKDISGSASF